MTGARRGQFRRILVGYDGSQESERALEAALAIANAINSRVEVLAVAEPSEPTIAAGPRALIGGARKHYDKGLRRIAESASQNGIQVETAIAVGNPAEQILKRAEQGHADLIVVGRRGTTVFEKLVMGSVSERVLRYAPCPVLVTR